MAHSFGQAVLAGGFGGGFGFVLASPCQCLQYGDHDRRRIDPEVPPNAGRVSEWPNPSVPSELQSPGTHREIRSGTARIQSLTATTGPAVSASWFVTNGT